MTDTVKAWIEERRAARVPNSTLSVSDAHNMFPRALNALEAVLEVLDAGVRDGDSAELIRRVALIEIEGAIND